MNKDSPDQTQQKTDRKTPGRPNLYGVLKDKLTALESVRLKKFAQYNFRKKLAIPAAVVLTPLCGYIDWLLIMWQRGQDDGAAGVTVLVLGGLYAWVTQPKRKYTKAYKKDILPKIASYIGDLTYRAKGRIPMGDMKPSKLIPDHDKYKTEDYFSGSYKGTDLQFCEAKLTERRGGGKHRRTVTVFQGLLILLDLADQEFSGHTILLKDRMALFEWIKETSTDLKRADLVDPEFEDIFDVFTNDQVEARYLIDPLMIERLKDLYKSYGGKTLMTAWYDRKMLIMIESKDDHFEPPDLHVPTADMEGVESMREDVEKILLIIDRLDLVKDGSADEKQQSASVIN